MGAGREAVELPDAGVYDILEGFVSDAVKEDEWVVSNPPPRAGQEGRPDLQTYLVGLREYVGVERMPER